MQVFLAGAAGLLGVVLIVAGIKGNGANLFSAITGVGVTGSSPGGTAPTAATGKGGGVAVPLGPTGPGVNAPVWT